MSRAQTSGPSSSRKSLLNPDDLSRTIITNTYLNALEAEVLSPIFNSNEIRKNRYPFEFDGRSSRSTCFSAICSAGARRNSFETDEELDNFPTPPFALVDVTNEPLFSGGRLCELTFSDVRAEIAKRRLLRV